MVMNSNPETICTNIIKYTKAKISLICTYFTLPQIYAACTRRIQQIIYNMLRYNTELSKRLIDTQYDTFCSNFKEI